MQELIMSFPTDLRLSLFITNLNALGFDVKDARYREVFQDIAIEIMGYDKEELDKISNEIDEFLEDKEDNQASSSSNKKCTCFNCIIDRLAKEGKVTAETQEFFKRLSERRFAL